MLNFYLRISKNLSQTHEIDAFYFADGQYIDKFVMDCDTEALHFLEKFKEIGDLESLAKCWMRTRVGCQNLFGPGRKVSGFVI